MGPIRRLAIEWALQDGSQWFVPMLSREDMENLCIVMYNNMIQLLCCAVDCFRLRA